MTQRKSTTLLAFSLVIGVIVPAASAQTTLYVDQNAGPGNNGQSWLAPFKSLEDALATARANPSITEIRVAGGVYVPSARSDPATARTETFQLLNGVAIYGGYAGLADPGDPDVRDLTLYESILSGDLAGDDVGVACTQDLPDCSALGDVCLDGFCILAQNRAENSYHVVVGSNTDETAVLDGFTVTGGRASESRNGGAIDIGSHYSSGDPYLPGSPRISRCTIAGNSAGDSGGGVHCAHGSHPTISECRIERNVAGNFGGGIRCHDGSNAVIEGSTFRHNVAGQSGGGLYCNDHSNVGLNDCVISDNIAEFSGGGIACIDYSDPEINGCLVSGNAANRGGGIECDQNSEPTIADCTVIANRVTVHGGGIRCVNGSNATITRCRLLANVAGQTGGGLNCQYASPTVADCVIAGNTAHGDASSQHAGGGIWGYDYGTPMSVSNTVISANTATNAYGGGAYLSRMNVTFTNCTLSHNSTATGQGLAIASNYPGYGGSINVVNSILWNGGNEVYISDSTSVTIAYSDVEGNWHGSGGQNVVAHPRFVRDPDDGGDGWGVGDNDDYGDLRLRAGSPAIDVGDNTAVPLGVATDLTGDPRFVDAVDIPDTGNGDPPLVDAGAYEFQATIVGDLDGDGDVDLGDFRMFTENFGGPLVVR